MATRLSVLPGCPRGGGVYLNKRGGKWQARIRVGEAEEVEGLQLHRRRRRGGQRRDGSAEDASSSEEARPHKRSRCS